MEIRTSDLPVCSRVPKLTALPCASIFSKNKC
jgi:hypothetical protein